MSCLNDAQIQAIVDREAGDAVREHAASCAGCHARMQERQALMQALGQAVGAKGGVPPDVSLRVERALADATTRGATRLRETRSTRWSWQRTAWSAGAVAAGTLIAILFIAPIVKGPATVSAAEILAKSANQLAARVTSGVEVLEYELALDGVPREMMPDHADGVYRVKQIIDHDTSGRYLVATFGPDGRMISSVAQDPATRQRVVAILVEDQPYRFEFRVPDAEALSLPEMERLHMQASVAMMQASGDQHLQVIDVADGRRYRIEVPKVSAQTPTAVWDLTDAEVVIDGADYHIVEFAVKGTFLKRPYSLSYRLIARSIAARVPADVFEVPLDPRAITVEGEGSAIPARDVLVATLREYSRMKRDGR
jgi:hypothetical protein